MRKGRYVSLVLQLCVILGLCGQQKGVIALSTNNKQLSTKNTYAVVVGISDYQDKGIPDLKYADKDAEAFANFLGSPVLANGVRLDPDHIRLLTNQQATAGQVAAALDWLLEQAKEGDQIIIYFSGHGDVERKTVSQPGFLLCWDALSNVYMGGGTYSLTYLQEIITTLSLQNRAKVLFIADACHSGKLAGSQIGGSQLTASNLSRQFANEVKILSCQPNEYSIEGKQWGGGRGAFSFHLIEAMSGMADSDEDKVVSLQEVGRYLEDHVSAEVAPVRQVPMILGDRFVQISTVDNLLVSQIRNKKLDHLSMISPVESKGFEDQLLHSIDTNLQKIYVKFKQTLLEKSFFEPQNDCADFYYEQLIKEMSLQKLHSTIKRNYAVALQDESQQVLINWLISDRRELSITKVNQKEKYRLYPKYLEKAANLLGSKHYMYSLLKANQLYFEGYLMHIDNRQSDKELGEKILSNYRTALKWKPDLAYIYNSMSWVYFYQMLNADSSEYFANKAVETSPNWTLPYTNLGFAYTNYTSLRNINKSKYFLEKVDKIDSNANFNNLIHMGNWAQYYLEAGDYNNAIKQINRLIELDSTIHWPYSHLSNLYIYINNLQEAEKCVKKAIQLEPNDVISWSNYGLICCQLNRPVEAKKFFKKAINLDSTFMSAKIGLIQVEILLGNYLKAESDFTKVIIQDSTAVWAYHNVGDSFFKMKEFSKSKYYFNRAINLNSGFADPYFYLANMEYQVNNIEAAFELLEKALMLGPIDYQAVRDYIELQALKKETDKWNALMKKFFPDQVK